MMLIVWCVVVAVVPKIGVGFAGSDGGSLCHGSVDDIVRGIAKELSSSFSTPFIADFDGGPYLLDGAFRKIAWRASNHRPAP
jgi:hypothetical protein